MLSNTQIDRYSRQIILPEVGARGQTRLLSTTLAILTPEPATSLLLQYLIAAGVGRISVCASVPDAGPGDWIEDASRLNSDCRIDTWPLVASPLSCVDWIETTRPTVAIADCTSDAETLAVNAACVGARKPLIWGRAAGAQACLAVFDPSVAPGCCACVGQAVLATKSAELQPPAASILASLAAAEALKIALHQQSPLLGRGLLIDADAASITTLVFEPNSDCALCARGPGR